MMTHQELNEALQVVHQQLIEADHLDAGDVERLRETIREIQVALDEQSQENALSHRVTSLAEQFTESHPVLTKTLGRVADMLQQMGI